MARIDGVRRRFKKLNPFPPDVEDLCAPYPGRPMNVGRRAYYQDFKKQRTENREQNRQSVLCLRFSAFFIYNKSQLKAVEMLFSLAKALIVIGIICLLVFLVMSLYSC